jgi:hypothetical protein
MARVHAKVARKEYKCSLTGAIIKKGDTYFEFTPYRSKPHKCSRYPKPSEMTGSGKLATLYSIREQMQEYEVSEEISSGDDLIEEVRSQCQEWAEEIRSVGEEYRDSVNNMPDSLQQSSKADEINEKGDSCDTWADEVENAMDNVSWDEPEASDEEVDKEDDASPYDELINNIKEELDNAASALEL